MSTSRLNKGILWTIEESIEFFNLTDRAGYGAAGASGKDTLILLNRSHRHDKRRLRKRAGHGMTGRLSKDYLRVIRYSVRSLPLILSLSLIRKYSENALSKCGWS